MLAVLAVGCSTHTASTVDQIAQGRELFQMYCARCHGAHGEGRIAPALIGPKHGLRGYQTAQRLNAYVSRIMPSDAPGTLKEDEYWAVLAFVLDSNGYLPKGTRLETNNAANVQLPQQ